MKSVYKILLVGAISGIIISGIVLIIIFTFPPTVNNNPDTSGAPSNIPGWIWISGNCSGNNNGTYGIKGFENTENIPGARYASVSWTDSNGNFWLFGGYGFNYSGIQYWHNDLWMFDSSNWTWMSGNYSWNNQGTYGIRGVPDIANIPGARVGSVSWNDSNGNFYIFGGRGYANASINYDLLNDLWKFDGVNWTWISGNYSYNNPGIYRTVNVTNVTNIPGARVASISWSDLNGNFWLFGGEGYDNSSNLSYLNDLWRFVL